MFGDVKIRIHSKLSVVVCVLITAILVALKITNTVDLSWWVVLLPMYGPLILAAVIYIGFCVYNIVESKREHKRKEQLSDVRLEQLKKRTMQHKSDDEFFDI